MWEEFKAIFDVDTQKPRFYWRAHAILILFVYEVLIHLFATPRVHIYNGADFWFVFFYNFMAPYGSVLLSVYFIIKYFLPIYQDWNGIKTTAERKADKAVAGAFIQARGGMNLMKAEGIKPPQAPPKKHFRPHWPAFWRLLFEGMFWGAVIYMFLRFPIFDMTSGILDGDVFIPIPLDKNNALRDIHTGWWQDVALAFGAGFYEELIFRMVLFNFLFGRMGKYFRPRSTQPNTKKVGVGIYSMILSILPAAPARNEAELASLKMKKQLVAVLLGSLIYSLSHYLLPYGDYFSTYTVLYRFSFGIILSIIFLRRGFAVAAWTHVWYDLFYFWFWGQ